jgi:hypothetical protein
LSDHREVLVERANVERDEEGLDVELLGARLFTGCSAWANDSVEERLGEISPSRNRAIRCSAACRM